LCRVVAGVLTELDQLIEAAGPEARP